MKFWLYSSASLLACVGLLYYTYITRQQFYPSVIYLVTSKFSLVVLGNAGIVLTTLFGRLLKSLFLGTLRDAEVELLHENVRYAVTETCLALTIFREEISFHIMVLFTAFVFLKIFHWLAQARIEFIEQTDIISRLTHVRLVGLIAMLFLVDTGLLIWCSFRVLELGPSVFILFGFEFFILFVTVVATFLRYVLYVVDSRMDGTWTNKFTYLFYLELVSEILKLVVYLVFFMLIFTYYGMPLHIVRDLWLSIKNLQRRIASYFRYRKITANLNERFPDPTEQELQETDRTCIICREEMTRIACKKLPCSHIFHVDCLKMWVQRQQTCPTCRSTIPTAPSPVVSNATAPDAARPAAPQAPEAAGIAPPRVADAAPRFRFEMPLGHAAPPPSQSGPTATGAAQPATSAAPAPAAGYGNPYMFHPGLGPPFGLGIAGAYGLMLGMPPQALRMDPDSIQRQIDILQAQLVMLQASAAQLGSTPLPTGTTSIQQSPERAISTPSTVASGPFDSASGQATRHERQSPLVLVSASSCPRGLFQPAHDVPIDPEQR
ncbi:hypothetical protein PsorP6_006885 [Peronosclerospora sorghi]|uniref:Uncharacterized protein n=1 Tax=Peronosclerospora sorghi TaxID=230839 RepID=A0ACC0W8J0_9STRA|nr:hypothetical protein PsorP6_006885 [Peronosclerospora sorghi]